MLALMSETRGGASVCELLVYKRQLFLGFIIKNKPNVLNLILKI